LADMPWSVSRIVPALSMPYTLPSSGREIAIVAGFGRWLTRNAAGGPCNACIDNVVPWCLCLESFEHILKIAERLMASWVITAYSVWRIGATIGGATQHLPTCCRGCAM